MRTNGVSVNLISSTETERIALPVLCHYFETMVKHLLCLQLFPFKFLDAKLP